MNFKKVFPSILSFGSLILTICAISVFEGKKNSVFEDSFEISDSRMTESDKRNDINTNKKKDDNNEMKAVWVPYIDLRVDGAFSEEKFKEKYQNILEKVVDTKLNTVIVQVRPFSDAFYPSKIFPWSHILTGIQGNDPGFDPLKFMVDETHARKLKFHAWVVPMRIKDGSSPKEFSDTNPYIKWKDEKYIAKSGNMIYYDPKYPEAREIIVNGVKEIVEGYDVDGVSFDDYFYPADNLWVDRKNYKDQGTKNDNQINEDIIRERKNSLNILISSVYKAIKSINQRVIFGICPQGNFENAYRSGADIDTWANNEGYVDYLCPEVYTNSTNPVLPFENTVSKWRQLIKCDRVKFYVGLGLYKTGTDKYDNGTWLKSDDTIMEQIEYCRKNGCDGFAIYSSVYLDKEETRKEIMNVVKIIN